MSAGRRYKVLFLSSWYPSEKHLTLGNFVQRHAEAVALLHEVHVAYVVRLPADMGDARLEHFVQQGVHHHILYITSSASPFFAFRRLLRMLPAHFEIVHHNVLWPSVWQAVYFKLFRKWPFIVTEHWTGFLPTRRHELSWWQKVYIRRMARFANAVCPVTHNLKTSMQEMGIKGLYRVVPNVVDTSLFHPSEVRADVFRWLHVSSLVDEHKNISGLLRAWKEVSDSNVNMHLQIGGDGPVEHWEKVAEELGIRASSISFFGEMPWQGIAEKMQQSDALVLFSRYENLPCVIVEAMASGLLVVSTDVGGISEHLTAERGLLVPSEDETALTKAMLQLPTLRNATTSQALKRYADDTFSSIAVAQQFTRIYREVLGHD